MQIKEEILKIEQNDLNERKQMLKHFESNLSHISNKFLDDESETISIHKQIKPPKAPPS